MTTEILNPKTELYKYSSISKNLKKTIKNNGLWHANPNTFNDPFDCLVHPLKQTSVGGLNEVLRISCFSKKNPAINRLQWAHYANSHKGVCLVFDHKTLEESNKRIRKVFYSDSFSVRSKVNCLINELNQNNSYKDFIYRYLYNDYGAIVNSFSDDECIGREVPLWWMQLKSTEVEQKFKELFEKYGEKTINDKFSISIINSISFKHSDWAYEEEWRSIKDTEWGDDEAAYKKAQEINGEQFSFNPKALKKVLFGVSTSDKDIKKVKRWIQNNQKYEPSLQFYRAKIDLYSTDLNFEELK